MENLTFQNWQLHASWWTAQIEACMNAESSACMLSLASVSYFLSLVIYVKADSADSTR